MAYTTTDREALERALAKGERRVTFGDKTVEYRSVDELRAALREVDAALMREAGRSRVRQIRITTSKAL